MEAQHAGVTAEADAGAPAPPTPAPSPLDIEPKVAAALEQESLFHGRELVTDDSVRKLDPDLKYGSCAVARFGKTDGWFCELSGPESERTGHSVFWMAAVTRAGAKLKELQRFPTQARALDFPEAIYATLRVEYDGATGTLTLSDGVFPCDRAAESEDHSLEYQHVVNRLCKARGTYVLQGGTFRRKTQAPALKWKGPPRGSATSGF